MKVLVLNAGSSSIKFQLISMPKQQLLASGLVERIGQPDSAIKYKSYERSNIASHIEERVPVQTHEEGLHKICKLLGRGDKAVITDLSDIKIVGHRVVHGGDEFVAPTLVTPAVRAKIESLALLAPLHNPANLVGIEVAKKIFTQAIQVAVFDTAFHQSLPDYAFRYALPAPFYEINKIRVYGFHGISHSFVSARACQELNETNLKLISLHLGNGCSAAAIKDGKSIDTSMGFGPLNGLIMGTRAGDIDPSVLLFMSMQLNLSGKEINNLLNTRSGMLGISGHSDLRDVTRDYVEGKPQAILAYAMAAYRIKKYIGAYVAILGGLDALLFTGGVGENDPLMRELVCKNMEHMGIELSQELNSMRSDQHRLINAQDSKTKILVIPTNEELQIAIEAYKLVSNDSA